MPQQVGRCIFCGGRGLTKEHVWPKWLRGALDPSITTPRHFYSTSGFGRRRSYTHRSGSIESRRMRIVCERCNTGWMSRLQNNEGVTPKALPAPEPDETKAIEP
jgi:hypothetical protein